MKTCSKCKQNKNWDEFNKVATRKDGHHPYCKSCRSIEKKDYRIKFKHELKISSAEYREKNKQRIIESDKEYYLLNKERMKARATNYAKRRRQTDLLYNLVCNMRSRIWHALKARTKSDKSFNLIGCSKLFLREYLESLFQPGMSWENYGHKGWHVDHITPCAAFDLSDPDQQRKCFHYTNLQPLWAKDNLTKSAKV